MKYWGSVRFFKHLIWLVIILIIGGSLMLGFSALQKGNDLAKTVNDLQNKLDSSEQPPEGDDQPGGAVPVVAEPIAYQQLFPDLYSDASKVTSSVPAGKTAFLTFDDGPSNITEALLDKLDDYGVKATFFVTAQKSDKLSLIAEAVQRGHTVGIHSYSHRYREVYQSVESYLDDFDQMYQIILEQTGSAPQLFRFPGGSVNAYNGGFYEELIAEMTRRGFVYYDWNVTAEDIDEYATVDSIRDAIVNGAEQHRFAIINCHDGAGHQKTVDAIGPAIEALQAEGYTFAALTPEVTPVHFNYKQEGN